MGTNSIVNPFFFQYPNDSSLPKIGTSGYSYKDWVGTVYPNESKPSDYLAYYQQLFHFCEINSTYYHMPKPSFVNGITKRAKNLTLTIKLPGSLTHPKLTEKPSKSQLEQELTEFAQALCPSEDVTSSIAGILLQLPYRFSYTKENRYYLAALCETLQQKLYENSGTIPIFVEFRREDWNIPQVYKTLDNMNLYWILTDLPPLPGLPQMEEQLRAAGSYAPAYVRLHGRRTDTWWKGTAVSRYDYLYSEKEIEEIAAVLQPRIPEKTIQFVAFNNHHKGKAVVNAIQLSELLLPLVKE